jgi:hypothetical protein
VSRVECQDSGHLPARRARQKNQRAWHGGQDSDLGVGELQVGAQQRLGGALQAKDEFVEKIDEVVDHRAAG